MPSYLVISSILVKNLDYVFILNDFIINKHHYNDHLHHLQDGLMERIANFNWKLVTVPLKYFNALLVDV